MGVEFLELNSAARAGKADSERARGCARFADASENAASALRTYPTSESENAVL